MKELKPGGDCPNCHGAGLTLKDDEFTCRGCGSKFKADAKAKARRT